MGDVLTTGIVSHKFLFFVCHSGLDPESSLSELDSRFRRDFNGVIYCTYQLVVTIVSDCFF
jgi:hypothetical protein